MSFALPIQPNSNKEFLVEFALN